MKVRCVVADPPWQYDDRGINKRGSTSKHYETMPLAEIVALGSNGIFKLKATDTLFKAPLIFEPHDDGCVLFLWTPNSFLAHGLAGMVMRAWGFEPKTIWTWIKTTKAQKRSGAELWGIAMPEIKLGVGTYGRNCTEHVIVGTIGTPEINASNIPTVMFAPSFSHLEKPSGFYSRAESMVHGPRLDMFARKKRPGWIAWGDEVKE